MSNITQFTMRIDNDVYEKIKQSAERNKRSIAKEIEFVLEAHYNDGVSIRVPDDVAKVYIDLLRQTEGFKVLEQQLKEAGKKREN